MKRALVCGAGGFIGHHLVNRLKSEGYWVRGVDRKRPEFADTQADEFMVADLRLPESCHRAVEALHLITDVYQLAADMGGMGFISTAECDILHNSVIINANMLHAAAMLGVKRYFFSSSACVYRNMKRGEPELKEEDAWPAQPDNEYGWEKYYSERMAMAYGRNYDITVRIARFGNCYGPLGTWQGGREKAPAAMCRKVWTTATDSIEIWGDGTAVRSYLYIDDLIEGIRLLMESGMEGAVNIGSPEYVTVNQLVHIVAEVAGKKIHIKHIPGPVGVESRNFSNEKIYSLGWKPRVTLREGIAKTYPWIASEAGKKTHEHDRTSAGCHCGR